MNTRKIIRLSAIVIAGLFVVIGGLMIFTTIKTATPDQLAQKQIDKAAKQLDEARSAYWQASDSLLEKSSGANPVRVQDDKTVLSMVLTDVVDSVPNSRNVLDQQNYLANQWRLSPKQPLLAQFVPSWMKRGGGDEGVGKALSPKTINCQPVAIDKAKYDYACLIEVEDASKTDGPLTLLGAKASLDEHSLLANLDVFEINEQSQSEDK